MADVEAQRLGAVANAPVWEAVEARMRADGTCSASFYHGSIAPPTRMANGTRVA